MKRIASSKGITLITLILYIIVTTIIIGILSAISLNFRNNLDNVDQKTVQDTEFDKLNAQLLKETKDIENEIDEEQSNSTQIVFSNGNMYTFNLNDGAVYLNSNIKVAEGIENGSFTIKNTVDNRQQLIVTVQINGRQRVTEYIMAKNLSAIPGQRVEKNTVYIDKNGDKATIPAEFTVSGVSNEQTIEGGLVIYLIPEGTTIDWTDGASVATAQQTYDQFVWIPVFDINDMYMCQNETGSKTCNISVQNDTAICTTHNSTLMAGRLYATEAAVENYNANLTSQKYTANSGLREPDILTSYDGNSTYLGYLSGILGTTGYNSSANFKTSLQTEYNEIVKSVYKNDGFYIGRYETSNITATNGNAVKVIKGTTTGINNINWYYSYAQQRDYATNKGLTVGSTMIQGAAYDQVVNFVNTADYSATTVGNVDHSFSSAYSTGSQSTDQSKNIYDLEGNVYTWTTEASNTQYRICSGRMF